MNSAEKTEMLAWSIACELAALADASPADLAAVKGLLDEACVNLLAASSKAITADLQSHLSQQAKRAYFSETIQ